MKKKNDRPTFWRTVYQETRDLIVVPLIDYFRCGKIWHDLQTGLVNFLEKEENLFYFFLLCIVLIFVFWAVFMTIFNALMPIGVNACVSSILGILCALLTFRYIFFKGAQYKEEQMQDLRNIAYTKLENDELPVEVEERVEEILREKT